MKIGYLGNTPIGEELAHRLVGRHGHAMYVIEGKGADGAKKRGASVANSKHELTQECDVIVLCTDDGAAASASIFGENGIFDAIVSGKVLVNLTRSRPSEARGVSRKLAERGVEMVDAAFPGSPAALSELTGPMIFAGSELAHEAVLQVLQSIDVDVFYCGTRCGSAQAIRLLNTAMYANSLIATLEAVAMGRTMSLSLEAMTDVLNKGSGANYTSRAILTGLLEKKPLVNFRPDVAREDVGHIVELGMELGVPLHLSNVTRGALQAVTNFAGRDARMEDVVQQIERAAGTKLSSSGSDLCGVDAPADQRDATEPTVGYVGLGVMGGALARRMLLSRKIHVFDVNAAAAREFESAGAIVENDLPSLARACDVIVICLPTSSIVRQAIFGEEGLAKGLAPGKILVDQTTGDPTEARAIAADLHKLGVSMVDAPVAGGPRGADAGTIAMYYGGPVNLYGRVRTILESISPNVVFCGDTGNGHVAKLVNAAVASANRLITYECASVAVKHGVEPATMARVINSSSGWNSGADRILPVLGSNSKSANFQLQLMVKDLRLGARMSIDGGAPMTISSVVRTLFETGVHLLGSTANLDDMAKIFEQIAAFKFSERSVAVGT